MSSHKLTRRDILRLTGGSMSGFALLNSPFGCLLDALTRGMYGQALAQAAGLTPRKWVDLRFDAAPPRWVYDLFLKPYTGGATLIPNQSVGTRYVESAGRYTDVEYATVTRKGVAVPWLWQFPVPKHGGGTRSMDPLLDHMLQFRGVNAGNPDHAAAQQLHYRPLGVQQTVPALSADAGNKPIPAVFANVGNFQFGSIKSSSPMQATGSNLIQGLMSPFVSNATSAHKANRTNLKAHLDATAAAFAAELRARNSEHEASIVAQQNAVQLLESSFGDLVATWNELFAKYNNLAIRAFDPSVTLAGINDKPIGITTNRTGNRHYNHNSVLVTNEDLRSIIRAPTAANPSGTGTMMSTNIASSFALAEFVLTRGLSDSLTLGMGTPVRLNINGGSVNNNSDEHFTGKMVSLLVNTCMARAHAACLLEFIDVLKAPANDLFDETIVNVSGEFNRRPRTDGTGSDHNWEGANYTMYSGCFQGPKIIGNIKAKTSESNYGGTWGYGAAIAEIGNRPLNLGHVSASIATMIRVPSPLTAESTVVEENASGNIVPIIPNGTNTD